MLAFHGKPEIKEKYLARVRAHAKADEIIHGKYWENGKGCAVGCTIHSGNHMEYESELGIPVEIAHLEDAIFESLPNGKSKNFPARFLKAIPVGADLSMVIPHFLYWTLIGPHVKPTAYPQFQPFIDAVVALYREWTRTGVRPSSDLAYRADLADRAYLAYLAYRADRAYLAYRAYRADLAYLAYRAYRADLADLAEEKLLELLAAAPVPEMAAS